MEEEVLPLELDEEDEEAEGGEEELDEEDVEPVSDFCAFLYESLR